MWVLQTLLLTMIYAAYSGDTKVFERGLALQSVLSNVSFLFGQWLTLAFAKSSGKCEIRGRESEGRSHVLGTVDSN